MYAQENQFFFPSTIKMYYMKLNDTDWVAQPCEIDQIANITKLVSGSKQITRIHNHFYHKFYFISIKLIIYNEWQK